MEMAIPKMDIVDEECPKVYTISAHFPPIPAKSTPDKSNEGKKQKKACRIFRWNILWFVLGCVVLVPLPLWLYPVHCLAGFITICVVTGWNCLVLLMCTIHMAYSMGRLYWFRRKKIRPMELPKTQPGTSLVHVVLMSSYEEPLDVIVKTLDTLKAQTVANRIFAIIAFEERTPDFTEKSAKLIELYSEVFLHMMITRHPYGVPGEIPGKCSNVNYASRKAVACMKEIGLYNPETCTFTICDTDNLFPPNYMETLGEEFLKTKNRHEVFWHPPLFYNYDLDKRPFFVRITGIMRGVFVLGMLIPQNINGMSIYSMSLFLLEKGKYFHPSYQFVEGIDNLVRMIAIGKTVALKMLPCPVISGPTSGTNLREETVEWARQAVRWTAGTAEIFHYFCIKLRSIPFLYALRYSLVFTHYYLFVTCSMALFSVTSLISTSAFNACGRCNPSEFLPSPYFQYIPALGIVFAYLIFITWFIFDALATRLVGVKENICLCRNILHWVSTPFVLFVYSCITYFAIAELAIRGKGTCLEEGGKEGLHTRGQQKDRPCLNWDFVFFLI